MQKVYLNRISTAVPPHDVHDRFLSYAPRLLKDERERAVFGRLSKKSQIRSRYSFLQVAADPNRLDEAGFYTAGNFPSTAQRMDKYKEHSLELASLALQPLFQEVEAKSITHVIVTTCTGSYAPGLDLEIVRKFGLQPSVERTMIGFMGCYAAMNGLKTAFHISRSMPEAKVLMVNLELCTLHLQENSDFESLLSFMQFSDGCAASLISSSPQGLELSSFHCDLIPEHDDLIQWHVGDSGFLMRLSLEVPRVLGQKLRESSDRLRFETKIWAVHPGGRSILDAAQTALDLKDQDLKHSRQILHDYGNMSSATIMFVLDQIMRDANLEGPGLAMAFGPGLSLETCRFVKRAGPYGS